MRVNITYRVIIHPRGRSLRVRFRRDDGQSLIVLFPNPSQFEVAVQQANLSATAAEELQGDVAVVAQMQESTYARKDLEIIAEELQRLAGSNWGDPPEFNLSFKRISEDKLRITAREVNPRPGFMSLNVHAEIPKERFRTLLSRVGMYPSEVRDLNMYGSQSTRRINEDEVETLIDSICH
jgi:hypothetical protein